MRPAEAVRSACRGRAARTGSALGWRAGRPQGLGIRRRVGTWQRAPAARAHSPAARGLRSLLRAHADSVTRSTFGSPL